MSDDLIPVLTRFHREVVMPDVRQTITEAVGGLEQRLLGHLDAVYQRFDRLESEYEMIRLALVRIEE